MMFIEVQLVALLLRSGHPINTLRLKTTAGYAFVSFFVNQPFSLCGALHCITLYLVTNISKARSISYVNSRYIFSTSNSSKQSSPISSITTGKQRPWI